jgi:hypothetical protein
LDWASAGGDPLPRAHFVPIELRTGYARSAFAIPVAATPSTFGWQQTSFTQESIFRTTAIRKQWAKAFVSPVLNKIPPKLGRIRIPLFKAIAPNEMLVAMNILIHETNQNFSIWGVLPPHLVPLMDKIEPDRIVDSLDILINNINRVLKDDMGLVPTQLILKFQNVGPEEITNAVNALIEDINAALTIGFGI